MTLRSTDKFAGGVIAAASVLVVAAMAHHPSSSANAGLSNFVHGTMMALTLMLLGGFARFAAIRGFDRNLVLFGFVAYAAGAAGNLFAAAVNGFAVPALAMKGADKSVFAFAWELNQALAYAAIYAMSAAFVLWGCDMLARGPRLVGAAGVIAGFVPTALLSIGALDMHVAGALIIYAAEAAFSLLVGLVLAFSGGAPKGPSAHS